MKKSKRARYWLKWNGVTPNRWGRKVRRTARAHMGKGDPIDREISTVYAMRFQLRFPASPDDMARAAGTRGWTGA